MVRWIIAGAGLIAILFAGCNSYTPESGVIVTGKIVQGGQPVAVETTEDGYNGLKVQFSPADPSDLKLASSVAMCKASGDFEMTYEGKGLPPGKYKVSVSVLSNGNPTETYVGKLDEPNSPITVEVPADKVGGKHDVGTIDIAQHLQ